MTNPHAADRSHRDSDAETLARSLSTSRRRQLLDLLGEAPPDGLEPEEIATTLAARTDATRDSVLVELRHRDVPMLAEAGLIERTDDGTIAAADDQPIEDREVLLDVPAAGLEAAAGVLEEPRRGYLLSVLRENEGAHETRAVARAVAACEADASARSVPTDRVEEVETSLVHAHLPALADAGVVSYDAEASRVALEERFAFDEELDRLLEDDGDECSLAVAS